MTTAGNSEFESHARTLLAAAKRDLARVNPKTLGREARQQYDSANQFARLAEQALVQRNFVFAESCANKAATLAALLVKG